MPKKNAKAQKSNELDGAEFFAAINPVSYTHLTLPTIA